MDIKSLLDPRAAAAPAPAATPKARNYASGIAQPAAVWAEMLQGFRHGKKRGETTHWPEWDEHFTWKPGEVSGWTGYNNSGKTEALLQLMLTKSVHTRKKWALWCPENDPISEIYDALAHALVGQSPDPAWRNQMTERRYELAKEFLFEHFIVIDPQEPPTLECLLDYFAHLAGSTTKPLTFGGLMDPWNRVSHHKNGRRDDEYLQDVLPDVVAFAKKYNQCFNITVHPTKPSKVPGSTAWRCPDQFDLAGGAMWGNMLHNVLAVHRPYYLENKANTAVEWHSHKIKKQKLVGRPGFVTLDFDYPKNRYMLNGANPLEPKASEIYEPDLTRPQPMASAHRPGAFPTSNFEEAPY